MLDHDEYEAALKNAKSARECFFIVRDNLPADARQKVEAHADEVVAHYMNSGEVGKAQLLYLSLKVFAMQEDGLL